MKTKIKKAFTLAETLIAIGIIGVVAALTIPTLVKKYQQRQTLVQLKKTYTVLSQAVRRAQDEEGDMSAWNFSLSSSDFLTKYIAPYIPLSKVSKGYYYTSLDDRKWYHTPTQAMNNGTLLRYANYFGYNILVDLNGYNGPNRLGRDLFAFQLINNSVYPYVGTWGTDLRFTCSVFGGTGGTYAGTTGQCNKKAQGGAFGGGSACALSIYCAGWTFPKGYPWD